MTTYVNLLDRIVEREGYELPDGTDMWTIRSVHPDLRSTRGYRWPFPGQWADAPGPIRDTNTGPCPARKGDGLCVATTWAGMASGGISARTLLLCAISTADALSPMDADKIRVRRALVVDVLDGDRVIRDHGARANLTRADLTRADLTDANLARADLTDAYLPRADLTGAILARANLTGAYLPRADLTDAILARANLTGAYLTDVILTGAYLTDANLTGARYNAYTRWPAGFDPIGAGAVMVP